MKDKGRRSSAALRLAAMVGLFAVLSSGCALKQAHYKSMLDLGEKSSLNYSQQVIDAIVGILDRAALPVFFNVEGGTSSWNPGYTAGNKAYFQNPFDARRSQWDTSFQFNESLSSAIQYNDFGSAAMSRVSALYALLCFPLSFGDVTFPNGSLYTIVDEADDAKNFLIWAKRNNGKFIGVTKAKHEDFLRFALDVTYWTPQGNPQVEDLISAPGQIYRLSTQFSAYEVALAKAVMTKKGMEAAIPAAQEAYTAKEKDYHALIDEAKKSKSNPEVWQTLLQFKREELQSEAQKVGGVAGQLASSDSDIKMKTYQLKESISILGGALKKIQAVDPAASNIDVDKILAHIQERIDKIASGDLTVFEISMPSATGLKAEESRDKLYRDRFESLPQRFEAAPLQAQQ